MTDLIEIAKNSFAHKVIENDRDGFTFVAREGRKAIIYFAEWCSPSRMMVHDLSKDNNFKNYLDSNNITLAICNADLKLKFGEQPINRLPTIVLYNGKKVIETSEGARSVAKYQELINQSFGIGS